MKIFGREVKKPKPGFKKMNLGVLCSLECKSGLGVADLGDQ